MHSVAFLLYLTVCADVKTNHNISEEENGISAWDAAASPVPPPKRQPPARRFRLGSGATQRSTISARVALANVLVSHHSLTSHMMRTSSPTQSNTRESNPLNYSDALLGHGPQPRQLRTRRRNEQQFFENENLHDLNNIAIISSLIVFATMCSALGCANLGNNDNHGYQPAGNGHQQDTGPPDLPML